MKRVAAVLIVAFACVGCLPRVPGAHRHHDKSICWIPEGCK